MDDLNRFNNNDGNDSDHPVLDERYDEEISAEIANPDSNELNNEGDRKEDHDADIHNIYGWVSVALSVISFFIIPILFAGAGIVVGFIARNKDAPILGNTAITIGVISILVRLFIVPLI